MAICNLFVKDKTLKMVNESKIPPKKEEQVRFNLQKVIKKTLQRALHHILKAKQFSS